MGFRCLWWSFSATLSATLSIAFDNCTWLDSSCRDHHTAADAEQWFGIVEKLTKQNGQPVNWAIRNSGDKLIGGVGLEGPGLDRSHRAEIGYWLATPYWCRGIMTAVVKAVCHHAFENLGLGKITAQVFSFNDASARVLEKCDYEQEGYLKKHFVKDGQFIDDKAYGLCPSIDIDWQRVNNAAFRHI